MVVDPFRTSATARPTGSITRGTTHPNRLRRADRWLIHVGGAQLRTCAQPPLVVDVGYGASGITSNEMYQRLRSRVRPDIEVLGLEIDPERVVAAQAWTADALWFARGGFELGPVDRPVNVIRAFNVLRQYDEDAVVGAWRLMARKLTPAGILLEGTCDEIGRRAAWVRIGSSGEPVSLTLSTHVGSLERPGDLAERLPKVLIHRNIPGERIHALFSALDQAWRDHAPLAAFGPRQRWVAMARTLHAHGMPIRYEPNRWRLGELTVGWEAVRPLDRTSAHR